MDILSSPMPSGKRCSKCKQVKLPDDFSGKSSWCKACARDYRRANYSHDYAKSRNQNLRTNYGISQEEYDLMFFQQGGVCAICHQPETTIDGYTGKPKALAVDHNHETGEMRELLCQACNHLLGWIEKDPQRVRLVMKYLSKHLT